MEFKVWMAWMILAAICIVGEVFTAGFFLLWFGIGAAVAGIFALIGLGAAFQWIGFIVISCLLFLLSRRFSERITGDQPKGVGADRCIGKEGVVVEELNNNKNTGRVRLEGEEWRAESDVGEIIPQGARVTVIRVEGTRLIVRVSEKGG